MLIAFDVHMIHMRSTYDLHTIYIDYCYDLHMTYIYIYMCVYIFVCFTYCLHMKYVQSNIDRTSIAHRLTLY